ncbi:MAG: FecCD family ABC transporter permease [Candidatus Methanomethylophilaceae archaeon]
MTEHKEELIDGKTSYIKGVKTKIIALVVLAVLLVIVSFVVLNVDLKYISYTDMFRVLFGEQDDTIPLSTYILVENVYLPRILAGIVAGFALGLAGTVMQCVLRNPLGSPYTLGISNAAAFGASIAIVIVEIGIGGSLRYADYSGFTTILAFVFAMLATGIIVLLVKVTRVDPSTMVLAGVAISSIFSAGISFLQYVFSTDALAEIVFWQFGSLGKPNISNIILITVILIPITLYFYRNRWDYNAIDSGDEVATSLGINVPLTRIVALVLCSLLTAVVVSFMGIIAFIGLVAPHMVRLVMGNDHRFLIPGSMLVGAMVLTVSDCIGQNLFITTIPVGIITSFLGGPLFLYLLISSYRNKNRRR